MKNIHILPTENYSPLVHSTSKYGGLFLSKYYSPMKVMGDSYQHIYITSDEEIKEGNWCYNSINNNVYKKEINKLSFAYEYKIILTTDQDLIKDGVQDIDDEFLEWFIKNPSCEKVEVVKEMYMPQSNGKISDGKITHELSLNPSDNTLPFYKIIISQEEPKQERVCNCGLKESEHNVRHPFIPKQETLEEVAREFYSDENQLMERIAFRRGYTECKERMYSEEDMIEFNEWVSLNFPNQHNYLRALQKHNQGLYVPKEKLVGYYSTKELFEQFKKK